MSKTERRKDISHLIDQLDVFQKNELLAYLDPMITDQRRAKLNAVLDQRTTHFCMAIEDLFYERNSGAIIRTADGYGVQNVHVIEPQNSFKSKVTNIISKGTEKWISKTQHDNSVNGSLNCIHELRSQGYQIVATSPHANGHTIHDFDITKKSAFFLGSEKTGISPEVMEQADDFISMPIYGFTESYNVSVAAAILLHELMNRLKASNVKWQLSDTERNDLMLRWTVNSIVSSDLLAQRFFNEKGWNITSQP